MNWIGLIVAGLIFLALVSGGGDDESEGGGSEPEKAKPDNGDTIGAQVVCEDEVRSQLKAPDTADFSDVKAARSKGSKFVVRGAVDSENSFGANLRAFWICDAEHLRGDRYRVNATVLE